jgi:hypothetical protein
LSQIDCGSISVDQAALFNILPFAQKQTFLAYSATNDTLNISFCQPSVIPVNSCGSGPSYPVFAVDQLTCDIIANTTAAANFELINADEAQNGFIMTYPSFNTYTVTVNMECNAEITSTKGTNFTYTVNTNSTGTFYTVIGQSSFACAFVTMSQFINFLAKYQGIFIAIGVIFGIFCVFWGLKMFNITIFVVVAFAGTFICGSLFYEFVSYQASGGTLWVVFLICVIIGCILGYLAVTLEKLGFFALGVALGVIGGMFLYQGVLAPFLSGHGSAVFYVFCGVLGLVGGLLSLWLYKDVIIFSTSAVGSYMAVRAVSVIFGGFPAEEEVASGAASFTPVAYVYLVCIGVLFVAGLIVQFKHKKEQEDESNMDNMDNISKNLGNTQY